MNIHRDPDAILAAWLDDGPLELPADTRHSIAIGIRTVTRRRPGIDWPFGGARVARPTIGLWRQSVALGSAAVVVVAAALALSFYANQQSIAGPATTATSAPTDPAEATTKPTEAVSVVPSSPRQRPSSSHEPSALRRNGEFIVFEPSVTGRAWNLAARDPETGELRTIVETDGLVDCSDTEACRTFIRKAEWSADGGWIAFEVSNASLDGPPVGPCQPTVGIWVQGPVGAPRQLTKPCDAPPSASDDPVRELWAWSPVGDRLAYVRIDGETDELLVIDPSDGARTALVSGNVDPPYPVESSSVVWSPDGSRIAYVDGSLVYAVEVDGGERSLLADTFEDIIDMAWSPDGTQILVQDQGRSRIQVMDADGSNLHVLLQGEDACCDMAWSPSGDRILYMLSGVDREEPGGTSHSELWTVAPDGSNPIEVFGDDSCYDGNIDGSPAWAPDGSRVAYNAPGCGGWVVENADGTGDIQRIDELVARSWYSGGLTGQDLAGIGQINH